MIGPEGSKATSSQRKIGDQRPEQVLEPASFLSGNSTLEEQGSVYVDFCPPSAAWASSFAFLRCCISSTSTRRLAESITLYSAHNNQR